MAAVTIYNDFGAQEKKFVHGEPHGQYSAH